MGDRPRRNLPTDATGLLQLAREDRAAARAALDALPLAEQVEVVCSAPLRSRAALIGLCSDPERLVPALPEAEFCFIAKSIGLESAAWLLECASPEQIATALDLDGWRDLAPNPAQIDAWLAALAEIREERVLDALHALDAELLVDWLRQRIFVEQKPSGDEGWDPPDGAQTLDGQFHFAALHAGDDLASLRRLLEILFQHDYWTYFRLLQGVVWELPSENQEWALRWRNGRLQDLGFPRWEDAIAIYAPLPAAALRALDAETTPAGVTPWRLPVWLPTLPFAVEAGHLVFRCIAQLDDEEREAAFYAFVALANKIAVADRMDLADAETTAAAIEKAAHWTSRGLEFVAREREVDPRIALRQLGLERLFRIGANLEPGAARPAPLWSKDEAETPPETAD